MVILLDLAIARVMGTGSGVKRATVDQSTDKMVIEFGLDRPIGKAEIERWRQRITGELSFSPGPPFVLQVSLGEEAFSSTAAASALKNTLEKI